MNRAVSISASVLLGAGVLLSSHGVRAQTTRAAFSDSRVTAQVQAALRADPITRGGAISVATHDGRVQLFGTASSQAQRSAAAGVAANVAGVVAVDNQLQLPGTADVVGNPRADAALTQQVRAALATHVHTQSLAIAVASAGGVVQLSGHVASAQQRADAARVAKAVQGVKHLDNQLQVRAR